MKLLFAVVAVMLLSSCAWNEKNQPEIMYLQAKSLPALKIPKRLQKTTTLQSSFTIPAGKLARKKDPNVNPYPPQFVKAVKI